MSIFNIASAPLWALGGAGLGAGARLGKNLADILRERNDTTEVNIKPSVAAVSEIPVDITPEEATELERHGIKINRKKIKQPTAPINPMMPKVALSPDGFLSGTALGALGLGGAALGFGLTDKYLDQAKKIKQQKQLDAAKKRIELLLNDTPAQMDVPLHAQMKAAEDHYFENMNKKADFIDFIDGIMPAGLGAIGGMGAVAAGMGAFNQAKQNNRFLAKAKALRSNISHATPDTPFAALDPTVTTVEGDEDKEEEKRRRDVQAQEYLTRSLAARK